MRVAVVVAGGSGSRSGESTNKVLVDLAGTPVLRRSVDAMRSGGADRVVVVARARDHAAVSVMLADSEFALVEGGSTRQQSEAMGVAAAAELGATSSDDVVSVHDAARPLVSPELVAAVFAAAAEAGAAYPVVEGHGLWHTDGGAGAEPRRPVEGDIHAAQTPQAARADLLHDAYRRADEGGVDATDTIEMLRRHTALPYEVAAVAGDPRNIKLTWPGDFATATRLLAGAASHEVTAVQSGLVQPTDTNDVNASVADTAAPIEASTAEIVGEPLPTDAGVEPDISTEPPPPETDEYAVLGEVEGDIADAQRALECLAVEGDEICITCRAAEADGTLAQRPALARCVAAKRA